MNQGRKKEYNLSKSVFWGLLFLLLHGQCKAFLATPDTLILDGEVIELEVEEISVNEDSLNRAMSADIKRERTLPRIGVTVFPFGVESAYVTWRATPGDSLIFLEKFLGRTGIWRYTSAAQAEVSVWINDYLGLRAGVSYTSWNTSFRSINRESLTADSARFGFNNNDGTLLQYYRFPVGVGFETDTSEIDLVENGYRSTQWALPFGMRVMLNPNSERFRWYVDLGGIFRFTQPNDFSWAAEFLNQSGKLASRVQQSDARRTRFFQAQVRVGLIYFLSENWYIDAQAVAVNFPSLTTASAPWLSDRISAWNMLVGVGYFFTTR